MISFAEHQENVNHFWSIGEQAYAIFQKHGAINPWSRQSYYQKEVSASDDGQSVHFSFECYDQGGTDLITIVLSNTLVDNFLEPTCVAAAIKQREANEAEAAAKKAAEAETQAANERTQLARMFVQRAENSKAEDVCKTALELASSLSDDLLNERIKQISFAGGMRMPAGTKIA